VLYIREDGVLGAVWRALGGAASWQRRFVTLSVEEGGLELYESAAARLQHGIEPLLSLRFSPTMCLSAIKVDERALSGSEGGGGSSSTSSSSGSGGGSGGGEGGGSLAFAPRLLFRKLLLEAGSSSSGSSGGVALVWGAASATEVAKWSSAMRCGWEAASADAQQRHLNLSAVSASQCNSTDLLQAALQRGGGAPAAAAAAAAGGATTTSPRRKGGGRSARHASSGAESEAGRPRSAALCRQGGGGGRADAEVESMATTKFTRARVLIRSSHRSRLLKFHSPRLALAGFRRAGKSCVASLRGALYQ